MDRRTLNQAIAHVCRLSCEELDENAPKDGAYTDSWESTCALAWHYQIDIGIPMSHGEGSACSNYGFHPYIGHIQTPSAMREAVCRLALWRALHGEAAAHDQA